MSAHRLDFADLDLVNADGGHGDAGFWFETLADGFDLGSPAAVKVIVAALMRDGVNSRIDHYENRSITFTVQICGPDLAALAAGEAALSLVVMSASRQQLLWTPPDAFGATTVFEVQNAEMKPQPDDLAEIRPGVKRRSYALTLECAPFGRSTTSVSQTLTPTTVTPTVIDAGSSLANWSSVPWVGGGGLALDSEGTESVIRASVPNFEAGDRTFLVNWSGTKPATGFVAVDFLLSPLPNLQFLSITLNGSAPTTVGSVTLGTATFTRYYFANPGGSSPYQFAVTLRRTTTLNASFAFANLYSATGAPGGIQTVAALGSVRSPGSVVATRATDMAWLFLYSDPIILSTGFSPAVRSSWAAAPDGTYVVYAQSWGATGDVLSLTFTDAAGRASTTAPTRLKAGAPTWRPIGELRLGGFRSGVLGALTITATKNGVSDTVPTNLRLFRKDEQAALTYVDGVAANTVELAAPSLDLPFGGVWADDVACLDKAVAWEAPLIVPPMTALYVEADNGSTSPVTTALDYFPRYHTYAAR